MIPVTCELFPNQIIGAVDPLIFGNFIEFTHDCIDEGLWAQLLHNRGFEEGEGTLAACWEASGYNDSGLYSLENDTPFQKGQSQKITLVHHFGGYKGMIQKGLLLESGNYLLSFWAKAKDITSVTARLCDRDQPLLWEEKVKIKNPLWNRYELEIQIPQMAKEAAFELSISEKGCVWFDQCSLMPEDAVGGVWKKVFEATAASRPTVMRFPGGCFADCYDWKDGIGERDARPARINRHWGGMEDNSFGTDEFMEFCKNLGCEPMICVNFGSAPPEDAAQWVEYCNGGPDTPMGKLRAKNGHPEPYHVKYWGLGNETWADWEIGNLTAQQYTVQFDAFRDAMRKVDPSIEFIACAGDGNSISQDWNRLILRGIGDRAEYIDLHFYAPQLHEDPADMEQIYNATVYAPHKYEKIIKDVSEIIKRQELFTKLMVGEYNAMYYNDSNREHTLETAIFNAGLLNVFLRNADMVHIGIFSDLVNGWQGGCIRNDRGEVCLTPSYYALCLYAEAGLQKSIGCTIQCPKVADVQATGHVEAMKGLPVADGAACIGADGAIYLFIVNRDPEEALLVTPGASEYRVNELREISGEHPWSRNQFGKEEVRIQNRKPENDGQFFVQPHSVCLARLTKE